MIVVSRKILLSIHQKSDKTNPWSIAFGIPLPRSVSIKAVFIWRHSGKEINVNVWENSSIFRARLISQMSTQSSHK